MYKFCDIKQHSNTHKKDDKNDGVKNYALYFRQKHYWVEKTSNV